MIRYKHVLALNPYFAHTTAIMHLFPPTGLEYIAASMKDLVGKVTLLDLRYEKAYQDLATLNAFIRREIDLVCVSIRWHTQFDRICDFVAQLPDEVPIVVGGYEATLEVEQLFQRCPNIDMVVRGDAMAVLTQYDFLLHGYFIYGNVDETAEEMLYISKFAQEIGLDTISFQKLRIEKFSPLKEVVESAPGYYYERIGGPVYSDRYGRKELKQIRDRIAREFYTPRQLLRIVAKARRIGLVSPRDVVMPLLKLPVLLGGLALHKVRKKKSKRQRRAVSAAGPERNHTPPAK
jgi:radical SAM superfamily enzyme YgiQ (UPF0313 family)